MGKFKRDKKPRHRDSRTKGMSLGKAAAFRSPPRKPRGRSSGSGRFGGGDRGRGRKGSGEMHKVVCDKCGKNTEVPFKPTAGKPVLCSDCFKKSDSKPDFVKELKSINEKLDLILEKL